MTPAEIRRAIRRLGACRPRPGTLRWNQPRAFAVSCLRLGDEALMAIYEACAADLDASGSDVHASIVAMGWAVTYNQVRTLRTALGFKGRGVGKSKGGEAMKASASSRSSCSVSVVDRMPGRLAAQLDQLPEQERRKVLAGWAR